MFSFHLYNSMSTSLPAAYKQSEEEDRTCMEPRGRNTETQKHENMFLFFLYNSMSL